MKWDFVLTPENRAEVGSYFAAAARNAQPGYVFSLAEPEKTRRAESRYHAMIDDIAGQCLFMGREWDADSWKRLLVQAYVAVKRDEARAAGEPDPFPLVAELVESLDGREVVQLGVQTREFTQEQSSEFIESLFYYGATRQVEWSEPAKRAIRQWRKAA